MPRVLIAVPEADELEPVLARFAVLGHASRPLDLGRITGFELPSLQAVASVGGHGKAQFALQTQYLVDRLGGLTALLCVGAAGSLCETLRLGDIVLGSTSVEHDVRLRFNPAPPPCHPATAALVGSVRELANARQLHFGVHVGAIASGDEDVVDPVRAAELRAFTGALCVAWEGSGGARVAAFNALRFLELRVITDGADADAALSFREHCARVMPNAADLIAAWLSSEQAARER